MNPNEITLVLAERGFLLNDYEIFEIDPSNVQILPSGRGGVVSGPAGPRVVGPDELDAMSQPTAVGAGVCRDPEALRKEIDNLGTLGDETRTLLDSLADSVESQAADAAARASGTTVRPATQAEALRLAQHVNAQLQSGQGSRLVPHPSEVQARAAQLQELIESSPGPVKGFNNRARIFGDKYKMLAALKQSMQETPPAPIPPCDAVVYGAGPEGIMAGCPRVRILHAPDGWVVRHTFTSDVGGQEITYKSRTSGDIPGMDSDTHSVKLPRFPGMTPQVSTVHLFLQPEDVLEFVSELAE